MGIRKNINYLTFKTLSHEVCKYRTPGVITPEVFY